MKVLCGRAAALFAGGDFGDYQNVRAITEPPRTVMEVREYSSAEVKGFLQKLQAGKKT